MANEITTEFRLAAEKGFLKDDMDTVSQTPDLSVGEIYSNTQTVSTSEETLTVGSDIATPGWAYFRNTDATNYIEIGVSTGVYMWKLMPGEEVMGRLAAGVTLYALANTANVNLFYKIYDT